MPIVSQDLLKTLAGCMDQVVFITDEESRIQWANDALEQQTGFTAADFQFRQPDNPFIYPEDQARVAAHIAAFVKSDALRSTPIENRFTDRWGAVHHYRSIVAKVLWDERPSLLFACTRIHDAPEREREASEARYRTLVENAKDAILRVDREGRVAYANEATRRLLGKSEVELGKSHFLDLVDERDRIMVGSRLTHAADRFETRFAHTDGDTRLGDVSIAHVQDDGESGLLAIIRDITIDRRSQIERAELERRLEEAKTLQTLGLLAAGVAHDFSNLLTVMLGGASEARRLSTSHDVSSLLDSVIGAARSAAALCEQMMAYAGRRTRGARVVDLKDAVRETLSVQRASLPSNVRIDERLGSATLMVDAAQLRQVAMNLIQNAVDALEGRAGVVEISTGIAEATAQELRGARFGAGVSPGPVARLRVRDEGRGMSADDVKNIFEPFFTTKPSGRGLGLANVASIAQTHGAAIIIDSIAGHGTRIDVLFPAAGAGAGEDEVPVADARVPVASAGRGRRALVADDVTTVRYLLALLLENAGFEVLQAADGLDAVDLFRKHHASLAVVLLDVSMPRLDGMATSAALRAIDARVPIVLTSGAADPIAASDLAAVGIRGFVQKPYSSESLLLAVEDAIGA